MCARTYIWYRCWDDSTLLYIRPYRHFYAIHIPYKSRARYFDFSIVTHFIVFYCCDWLSWCLCTIVRLRLISDQVCAKHVVILTFIFVYLLHFFIVFVAFQVFTISIEWSILLYYSTFRWKIFSFWRPNDLIDGKKCSLYSILFQKLLHFRIFVVDK